MVTASHRTLGDTTLIEFVRREGSAVRFDSVSAPPGIAFEDCFNEILSPQPGFISEAARQQAKQIAEGIRLGRVGNSDGQVRH